MTETAVQGIMYCNKLFELERRNEEQYLKPETPMKHCLKHDTPVIEI